MGNSQKLFILKLEPDLHPEPEKLSDHGVWVLTLEGLNGTQLI